MNVAQAFLTLVILGLMAVGGYVMHWLFGIVGVAMFGLFMLPMLGLVYWILANSGGSGGGSTTGTGRRASKGARED